MSSVADGDEGSRVVNEEESGGGVESAGKVEAAGWSVSGGDVKFCSCSGG